MYIVQNNHEVSNIRNDKKSTTSSKSHAVVRVASGILFADTLVPKRRPPTTEKETRRTRAQLGMSMTLPLPPPTANVNTKTMTYNGKFI